MAGKGKTVLVVYAHHYEKSLNAAILDTTVKTLNANGCNVIVSDLYAQNFNPLIGSHDIKGLVKSEGYNYVKAVTEAATSGNLKDDIAEEQKKLSKADLVIFQFPMMWLSVPAILKGWFDRVLTSGHAFNISSGRIFENGPFKGKRAILSFTTGSPGTSYTPEGINGDMNVILHHIIRGPLQLCGFDVLTPHVINSAAYLDRETLASLIQAWVERIPKLWTEACIPLVPLHQFDLAKGLVLKEDSKYRQTETAPSAGIHCGKPIGKQ